MSSLQKLFFCNRCQTNKQAFEAARIAQGNVGVEAANLETMEAFHAALTELAKIKDAEEKLARAAQLAVTYADQINVVRYDL